MQTHAARWGKVGQNRSIARSSGFAMYTSAPPTSQTYSPDAIQQILQLAIARQADNDEFSREQLLEIARELEISPENLQAAEHDWLTRQGEQHQRAQFDLDRRTKSTRKIAKYAIVSSVFILLNLLSAGTVSWSLYLVLPWGVAVGLKQFNLYNQTQDEYEKEFQTWCRRQQLEQSVGQIWDRLNTFLRFS
jgi:2TM domain